MRRPHFLAAGLAACALALFTPWTPAFAAGAWALDGTNHPSVGWIFAQQSDPATCSAELTGGCAAILISSTVAVTSGGCAEAFASTTPFNITAVWLNMNPANPFDCATASRVASLHLHPDYSGPGSTNNPSPFDVGVLVLDAPSPFAPASLPAEDSLGDLMRGDPFEMVTWYAQTGGVTQLRRSLAPAVFTTGDAGFLKFRVSVNGQNCTNGNEGAGAFLPSSQSLGAITVGGSVSGCRNATMLRLDTPSVRSFLGGFVTLP